jgi:hypothetical protein
MGNGLMDSDNAHGRIMQGDNFGGATNTVESCIAACISRGFTLAGMEYSSQFPSSELHFVFDLTVSFAAECCMSGLLESTYL